MSGTSCPACSRGSLSPWSSRAYRAAQAKLESLPDPGAWPVPLHQQGTLGHRCRLPRCVSKSPGRLKSAMGLTCGVRGPRSLQDVQLRHTHTDQSESLCPQTSFCGDAVCESLWLRDVKGETPVSQTGKTGPSHLL